MSAGRRVRSAVAVKRDGNTRMPMTTSVKNSAWSGRNHPVRSSVSSATGTRLRRTLSKIFQRDSAERGFDVEDGGWDVEDSDVGAEDGGWRMEDGAGGLCRPSIPHSPSSILPFSSAGPGTRGSSH